MIKKETNAPAAAVTIPNAQLAQDTPKDPCIFDLPTLNEPFRRRKMELIKVDDTFCLGYY